MVGILSSITGCGDAAPVSNSKKAMNEYFWGKFSTGCVAMSEKEDFINMRQAASSPMGAAFIDHHDVQPANWNNGNFLDQGELSGEIERVVYLDDNCEQPTFRIVIPLRGNANYTSTAQGITLQVEPVGTIKVLDEAACRYLEEQFEWDKNDLPAAAKKCEVGDSYDRGNKLFQASRKTRYPNIDRLSNMPYEITYVESTTNRLSARAPRDFFVNIFNWVAEYDFGRSPLAALSYPLTGTKRVAAP